MEHTWTNIMSFISGTCFAFIAAIFSARRGMVEKGTCTECKSHLTSNIIELKNDMKDVKKSIGGIETNMAVIATKLSSCACGVDKC